MHDTYFVVAHFHYVLIGGMVFPIFAALYYWTPLVTGRMLSERLGRWAFWLMFVGFNAAFFPMHVTGLRGMPRRIYTYSGRSRLELAQPDLLGVLLRVRRRRAGLPLRLRQASAVGAGGRLQSLARAVARMAVGPGAVTASAASCRSTPAIRSGSRKG